MRAESALAEQQNALADSRAQAEKQSTYLANLTERLDQASASMHSAKTTLLRTMGHELKTPLNAILGFSDLMATLAADETVPGFVAPVHRALTEPILLGGAPRAVAILNGTLAAALGLGLRLWIPGLLLWVIGHTAAVWAAKRDPMFVDVVRRHLRIPGHLGI